MGVGYVCMWGGDVLGGLCVWGEGVIVLWCAWVCKCGVGMGIFAFVCIGGRGGVRKIYM